MIFAAAVLLLSTPATVQAVPAPELIAKAEQVLAAAKAGDRKALAATLAPDAVLRLAREKGGFTVERLHDLATNCRLLGSGIANRPASSEPWASLDLSCDGSGTRSYAATFWFDGNDRITYADILAPLAVPG